MKFAFFLMALTFLAFPDLGACYPVKSAEDCKDLREDIREVSGVLGGVIIGEGTFLTLIRENGDEFILMAEDGNAVDFYREGDENQLGHLLVLQQIKCFFVLDADGIPKPFGNFARYHFHNQILLKLFSLNRLSFRHFWHGG